MKKVGLVFALVLFFAAGVWVSRYVAPAGQVYPDKPVAMTLGDSKIAAKLAGTSEEVQVSRPELDLEVERCLGTSVRTAGLESRPDYELDYENFHYADSDGTEKRAQLQPRETEVQAGSLELRLFSVDREGLPVPLQIIKDNWIGFLNDILKRRHVHFHQKKGHIDSKDLGTVMLLSENDVIRELQWSKGQRQLRCADDQCFCDQQP